MPESDYQSAEVGSPLPVYVLVGDAPVLLRRAERRLLAAITPLCGLAAFNVSTFSADDGMKALSTARTLPMMADRRLVVVRELESADDAFFSALAEYLEEGAASQTTLIATGSGFPKVKKGSSNWKLRLSNAIKRGGGGWIEANADSVRPAAFAQSAAVARGKRLGAGVAAAIVEIAGRDLDALEHEVEKLSLYVGDAPEIDRAAVEALTTQLSEAVVWDLTKGIAASDPELALRSLHRLLAGQGGDGDDQPDKLLSLVTWQMRELLSALQMARLGASDEDIRRATKANVEVVRGLLAGPHAPTTAPVLEELLRANRQMHASPVGGARVLEGLVLRLATQYRRERRR